MSKGSDHIFEVRDSELVKYTNEQHDRYHDIFNKYVKPTAIGLGLLAAGFCAKAFGLTSPSAWSDTPMALFSTGVSALAGFSGGVGIAAIGESLTSSFTRRNEESLSIPDSSDEDIQRYVKNNDPEFVSEIRETSKSQISDTNTTAAIAAVGVAINAM